MCGRLPALAFLAAIALAAADRDFLSRSERSLSHHHHEMGGCTVTANLKLIASLGIGGDRSASAAARCRACLSAMSNYDDSCKFCPEPSDPGDTSEWKTCMRAGTRIRSMASAVAQAVSLSRCSSTWVTSAEGCNVFDDSEAWNPRQGESAPPAKRNPTGATKGPKPPMQPQQGQRRPRTAPASEVRDGETIMFLINPTVSANKAKEYESRNGVVDSGKLVAEYFILGPPGKPNPDATSKLQELMQKVKAARDLLTPTYLLALALPTEYGFSERKDYETMKGEFFQYFNSQKSGRDETETLYNVLVHWVNDLACTVKRKKYISCSWEIEAPAPQGPPQESPYATPEWNPVTGRYETTAGAQKAKAKAAANAAKRREAAEREKAAAEKKKAAAEQRARLAALNKAKKKADSAPKKFSMTEGDPGHSEQGAKATMGFPLNQKVTKKEVMQNYRTLALSTHPDKISTWWPQSVKAKGRLDSTKGYTKEDVEKATEDFQLLTAAKDYLLDCIRLGI